MRNSLHDEQASAYTVYDHITKLNEHCFIYFIHRLEALRGPYLASFEAKSYF